MLNPPSWSCVQTQRDTIAEREALEREEEEAAKREDARRAARAAETREIVIEQIKMEEAAARASREGAFASSVQPSIPSSSRDPDFCPDRLSSIRHLC